VLVCFSSCKKDAHVPPKMSFKTTTGYTSADATAAKTAAITVGITADKTEDDLSTYNVSVSYDGGASSTKFNGNIDNSSNTHFEKDFSFATRDQAGSEKWTFTITDRDGNITTQSITITVQ
jgi:hypothetical protein